MNMININVSRETLRIIVDALEFRETQMERKANTEKNEAIKTLVRNQCATVTQTKIHLTQMELNYETIEREQEKQQAQLQQNSAKDKGNK